MIDKVSSVDTKTFVKTPSPQKAQSKLAFKGAGDLLLQGIQICEKNPMINVSVLDLSTAIIPRSVIETKESNAYAGMEAFRRESSGLIVNCLLPSFIVMGVSKLLNGKIMKGYNKGNLTSCWANEESLNIIQKYYSEAKGNGTAKLENALNSFINDLSGVDGKEIKAFKDFDLKSGIKSIAEASAQSDNKKSAKKLLNKGYQQISEQTHITENIRLKGSDKFLSKNLKGLLEDFIKVHNAMEKEGLNSTEEIVKYINKAKKLVNTKSLGGLSLIIPLAISMQPLNRWITAKHSGQKGAPIYKDFETGNTHKELNKNEKFELLKQKFISVGSMLGVAFLSMGCKLPSKQMLQFKGIFPTMDQARIISTATFASRMMSSEDKNELREATIRDIATFSSLYFLGDYAAKGVACAIEKFRPDVKLLNTTKELQKDANIWKKMKHWIKDVSLKSSDEVVGKAAKNLRSVCQLGNLAFSLLALGVFIPLYTRTQTNKKREAELRNLATSINSTDGFLKDQIKNSSPAFSAFFK